MVVLPAPVGPYDCHQAARFCVQVKVVDNHLVRLIAKLMSFIWTSPLTSSSGFACGRSAASAGSSIMRKTRSAAAAADCSSLMMFAISLTGPENLREYSTKEERLPSETLPHQIQQRAEDADKGQRQVVDKADRWTHGTSIVVCHIVGFYRLIVSLVKTSDHRLFLVIGFGGL